MSRPAKRMLPSHDPQNNIGAVDRIRVAMVEGRMDELHQDEKTQLLRWMQIDDLIRQGRLQSDSDIVQFLLAKYSYSLDTAYRDIRSAKQLFAFTPDEHEYYRKVYIEQLEKAAAKALIKGNYEQQRRNIETAAKLRGLFEAKNEVIPYDKLEAFQVIMQYNPEAVGLKPVENKDAIFERYMKKKRVSEQMQLDAEEAEYDE
ncbi:hypothetical protein D3C78_1197390 [compost metagenome]